MPRVLVALASVGLRASSFTLATQRRQPNAFRRNMGALQSTAADEQELRGMIQNFAEDKTGEWLAANSLPDACFIRPSGNPIPSTQFATFLAGDVCITEKNLIKIHKLDVGTDMAFAATSESGKFTYKGQPNDDPSFTVSSVWKKSGGSWKLAWAHRSTATGNDMSTWESFKP